METAIENEWVIVAKEMMLLIAQDNGAINAVEKFIYKEKYVNSIAKAVETFFTANPHLLTNEHLEEMCTGGDIDDTYGKYSYWNTLSCELAEYFNHL